MTKLPKLPPPAQAGDGTPEGEVITELIKMFASGGTFISCTEDEAEAFRAERRRCTSYNEELQGQGAIVTIRRGKTVWRIPGKGGADLDRPPMAVKIARMEQRYKIERNKAERTINLIIRNRAGKFSKSPKTEQQRYDVLTLAAKYANKGRNLSAFIAKRLGVNIRTVQRILKDSD